MSLECIEVIYNDSTSKLPPGQDIDAGLPPSLKRTLGLETIVLAKDPNSSACSPPVTKINQWIGIHCRSTHINSFVSIDNQRSDTSWTH